MSAGRLVLIDAIFVAGRELIAAVLRDARAVAARIPPHELRAFLQIACFEGADADADPVFQRLRRAVDSLSSTLEPAHR